MPPKRKGILTSTFHGVQTTNPDPNIWEETLLRRASIGKITRNKHVSQTVRDVEKNQIQGAWDNLHEH